MGWSPKRILALFLGLWIGLSPALISAPAASMTFKIAETPDSMSGNCECCPGTKPNRALCPFMCVGIPSLAAVQCTGLILPAVDDEFPPELNAVLTDRIAAPDPPPPRRLAFT
jgi:hypothetical protein